MDAGARPGCQALPWLLLASLFVLLPLLPQVPIGAAVAVAALLAWRAAHCRFGWPIPGRGLRIALTALLVASVLHHFGTLLGRDPGVTLLVVLLGLKLLEAQGTRDAMLCVLLLYVLIGAAFLFDQSLWLGAYALAAVTLTLAALFSLTQPAGVGAGARLRLGGVLVLKALPLMLVVYLLFPRIEGSLWRLSGAEATGVTGLSDTMRPGSVSQLALSDRVAFRAEFADAVPPPHQRYWRTLILWETDGRTWSRGGPRGQIPTPVWKEAAGAVNYTIALEATNRNWLSALDLPASRPRLTRLRAGYLLEHLAPVRERLRYSLTSYTRYNTGPLATAEYAHALQLPARVSPRIRELAAAWRAAAGPEASRVVRAALAHFATEDFVYTLRPPLLGADPVDEFLFESRRGFCEHFAAAFVTLMRAAGIPSRVVTGYQGGEYNPNGNYLIVREGDAHAWAEVWLRDQGWVRIDPTAAVAPERVEYGMDAIRRLEARGVVPGRLGDAELSGMLAPGWAEAGTRTLRLWWDGVNTAWDRWTSGYTRERQRDLLAALGLENFSWSAIALLLAALVAILLAGLALTFRIAQLRDDPVQRAWRRYCARLARLGLVRAPHEGPLDFAERCAAARPDLAPAIGAVTRHYVSLHYGGGEGDVRLLREAVRRFRPAGMRESALESVTKG